MQAQRLALWWPLGPVAWQEQAQRQALHRPLGSVAWQVQACLAALVLRLPETSRRQARGHLGRRFPLIALKGQALGQLGMLWSLAVGRRQAPGQLGPVDSPLLLPALQMAVDSPKGRPTVTPWHLQQDRLST